MNSFQSRNGKNISAVAYERKGGHLRLPKRAHREKALFKTLPAPHTGPALLRAGPHPVFPSFLKMTIPRGGTVIETE